MVPALLDTSLVFVIRSASFQKKKKISLWWSRGFLPVIWFGLLRKRLRDLPLEIQSGTRSPNRSNWRRDGELMAQLKVLHIGFLQQEEIQGDAKLSAPERDYRLVKVSRVPLIDCA